MTELNKYIREIMFLRSINYDNPYSIKVNFLKENGICEVAPDGLFIKGKESIAYFNSLHKLNDELSRNIVLKNTIKENPSIVHHNHPFIRIDFTPYEVGSREQVVKFKNLFVYIKKMSPNKEDTFEALSKRLSHS